jgi:hypothetical protein
MDALLKKLQLAGEPRLLVLNAPESFAPTLEAWRAGLNVDLEPIAQHRYGFVLGFALQLEDVEALAVGTGAWLQAGDAKLWVAYPKASSKRYRCAFNRDTGWQALGDAGFEGVRQIAVDEDWSALRFRRVEFIRSLTRKDALSEKGKSRTAAKR